MPKFQLASPVALSSRPVRSLAARFFPSTCLAGLLLASLSATGAAFAGAPPASDTRAECRLTFDATWSSDTHPTDFPPNPHFSPLVGGTHGPGVVFWDGGSLASDGIVAVAETGATGLFRGEIEDAIGTGAAAAVIAGSGVGLSPGTTGVDFVVDLDHPLVTVVTMIAPSPDWFVGVHGLPLLVDGRWVESRTVDLPPYDAGSDSGTTFLSSDVATIPADPIALLSGFPFSSGRSLGTFRFDCTSNLLLVDGFESGTADAWLVP